MFYLRFYPGITEVTGGYNKTDCITGGKQRGRIIWFMIRPHKQSISTQKLVRKELNILYLKITTGIPIANNISQKTYRHNLRS